MKKFYYSFLLLLICKSGFAQTFLNGDLDGSVNFVSTPTNWQEIPFTDPICQANTVAEATVDILDATAPNSIGGVAGNPFSGTTFCSGLHSSDGGALLWHEGIMQTINGFVIGNTYSIDFRQAVVKQQNHLDESGSWRVYLDGNLIATSAVSTSTLAFDDVNIQWDCRNVSFTATAATHTIKFIPWDDDANLTTSTIDITGGLRMGIDLIEFTPIVDATINPAGPFCDPTVVYQLTAVTPGGVWSGVGITDSIIGSYETSIPGLGNHWVYYTLPNGCGTVTDSVEISIYQLTYSSILIDESCSSSNGVIEIIPDTGTGPYGYVLNGSVVQINGVFSNLPAGNYTVDIIDSATGCFGSGMEVLINTPGPILDSIVSTDPTCSSQCDGTISIYASGATTYTLSQGGTNAIGQFNSLCSNSYSIIIDEGSNCAIDTVVELIGASEAISQFTFSPSSLTPLDNTVSLFNSSTGADSYIWIITGPNGFYEVFDHDITLYEFPETTGTFEVCLIAENNGGCPDTTCKSITMRDELSIFIPNTFTPNSDEFNNFLVTHLNGIDNFNFEMTIFNRWGEIVFITQDKDHYWDGTYLGKPVPDGAYNWKIEVKNPDNDDREEYIGHVNVIR